MTAREISGCPLRAGLVALLCAVPARSQDLVRALATGDRIAVETARRQALVVDDLPLDGLRQLLRSADPHRRAAAASVLAVRAPADPALAALWNDERDPRVLTLRSIKSSCELAEAMLQLVFSSVERALGGIKDKFGA